jgi:hypothetical protein
MLLEFVIIYLIVCCVLAFAWAAKKRIGDGWGFFFLFFWGIIPGIVVISISPSKKRVKELKDGAHGWDKSLGVIGIILAVLDVMALLRMNNEWYISQDAKNYQMLQYLLLLISFIGLSVYMFGRVKRHERIYNELNNPIHPPPEKIPES